MIIKNDVKCKVRKLELVRTSSDKIPQKPLFRVANLNVGIVGGRSSEAVETVSRKDIGICSLEIPWRGASARFS